jgi:hypothetical protein
MQQAQTPISNIRTSTNNDPSTSNANFVYPTQTIQTNMAIPPPTLQPTIPLSHAFSVPGGSACAQDQRSAFLRNAHRVGMKALDTMGSRNHDDNRSYSKYSQVCIF